MELPTSRQSSNKNVLRALHVRKPSNIPELKLFFMDESAKIYLNRYAITEDLVAVIAAQEVLKKKGLNTFATYKYVLLNNFHLINDQVLHVCLICLTGFSWFTFKHHCINQNDCKYDRYFNLDGSNSLSAVIISSLFRVPCAFSVFNHSSLFITLVWLTHLARVQSNHWSDLWLFLITKLSLSPIETCSWMACDSKQCGILCFGWELMGNVMLLLMKAISKKIKILTECLRTMNQSDLSKLIWVFWNSKGA